MNKLQQENADYQAILNLEEKNVRAAELERSELAKQYEALRQERELRLARLQAWNNEEEKELERRPKTSKNGLK